MSAAALVADVEGCRKKHLELEYPRGDLRFRKRTFSSATPLLREYWLAFLHFVVSLSIRPRPTRGLKELLSS